MCIRDRGVTAVDANDVKSSYGNYGSWVKIAAPGDGIYSTYPVTGFATWTGTSMATPFVTGEAALLLSKNHSLTPRQLALLIAGTADSLDVKNPSFAGQLGRGRINVLAALNKLVSGTLPNIPDVIGNNCGESQQFSPTPTANATPSATPKPAPSGTPAATPTPAPSPTPTPAPTTAPATVPVTISKVIATLNVMPAAPMIGAWDIGGVSYQSDAATTFDSTLGPLSIGACAQASYTYGNSSSALILSSVQTVEAYKCQGASGATPLFQSFGPLESIPPGVVASAVTSDQATLWRVGAIGFTTNTGTTLSTNQGSFAVGRFVAVSYSVVNSARVATQIETHVAPGAGPKNMIGKLTVQPSDVWGTWVVGGMEFQGDRAIDVQLRSKAPGQTVILNYYDAGGKHIATQVRELPSRIYVPLVAR